MEATPAGEHIHMPEPSLLPLINAASLAGAIVMVTLSWILFAVFLIVFLISTVIWIRSTARETAALPLEHH
jgi:TRAP-type C4-dicarboxylate transport system permease small subunit